MQLACAKTLSILLFWAWITSRLLKLFSTAGHKTQDYPKLFESDTCTYTIPVLKSTYMIPVFKCTYLIPVFESTYTIPIFECTYMIPVFESTYMLPLFICFSVCFSPLCFFLMFILSLKTTLCMFSLLLAPIQMQYYAWCIIMHDAILFLIQ